MEFCVRERGERAQEVFSTVIPDRRERGERAQEIFSTVIPDRREILLSELHGRIFMREGYSGSVFVAAQMLVL